jgi:hypothetical protein
LEVKLKKSKSLEAVETILGSPVSPEYSDNALKVRRNLLVSSFVSCMIAFGQISLDPTSSILGFKFVGLTDDFIRKGLAVITLYYLVHFLWYAFDASVGWRLRITGTNLFFITAGKIVSELGDYPDDPKQSTLYSWWLDQAKEINKLKERIQLFEIIINKSENEIQTLTDCADKNRLIVLLSQVETSIKDLRKSVDDIRETIESPRIVFSLSRFDNWFCAFLKSQNIRWAIIDTLLPILFGFLAVSSLLIKYL